MASLHKGSRSAEQHYAIGPSQPEGDNVMLGVLWVDTLNGQVKRCSSTDPIAFVSAGGGMAAHGNEYHSPSFEQAGVVATHESTYNHGLLHSNANDHSHGNKTLLDTYTQAETNLADAVTKKHDAAHNHTGVYESANTNIQVHVTATHAPSNAQKNSDILKSEIEAKLTGEITSHTHAGGGGDGEVSVMATQNTQNATTTLANATGLAFSALASSTYIIEVFLLWDASAATVGIKVTATASGTPNITAGHFITDATNGTPDSSSYNANDVVVTTSASAFTTYNLGMLHAILKTSTSASTWQLRFAAETTGTITVKAGSVLRYRKVA